MGKDSGIIASRKCPVGFLVPVRINRTPIKAHETYVAREKVSQCRRHDRYCNPGIYSRDIEN